MKKVPIYWLAIAINALIYVIGSSIFILALSEPVLDKLNILLTLTFAFSLIVIHAAVAQLRNQNNPQVWRNHYELFPNYKFFFSTIFAQNRISELIHSIQPGFVD